jgi:hypothetical protein
MQGLIVMDIDSVMIGIDLILERRFQLLSLRYRRLSATGSGKHTAVEVALARHKESFIADQRGAVAFEMPIVYLFLMMSLLLPLADVAIAGFQFISAWEALRELSLVMLKFTKRSLRVEMLGSVCGLSNPII